MLSKTTKALMIFLAAILLQVSSALATPSSTVTPATSSSTASNFGASCAPLAAPGDATYLSRTAYGYIQNNISMPCTPCALPQTSPPTVNCQDTNSLNLTLCIRNTPTSNSTACTLVTVSANQSFVINLASANGVISGFTSAPSSGDTKPTTVFVTSYPGNNQLCLTMMTPFGITPLMCKSTNSGSSGSGGSGGSTSSTQCTALTPACYGTSTHSQSPFNFSGQAFECLTGSLNNIFFQTNSCGSVSDQTDSNLLASFPSFQNALRLGIAAAMIIYIIFFGLRLALGEEKMSLDKLSMAAIKLILVAYFAIGIGPLQYVNNQVQSANDGTTETILPLLNEAMVDFAQIVFNAGGSRGLCEFDETKYDNGYAYYSLFDAIDCRIAYYLGMNMISNPLPGSNFVGVATAGAEQPWSAGGGPAQLGMTNTEFFGFFFMIFGLLLGGNFVMLIFSLTFLIVFLGITLHFISSFLVCVITLYVMIYVSPIFVTFALFNRTKGYFDSWVKILVSCSLQPAVLAGFLALVVTMFDSGMYNTCEFNRYTLDSTNNSLSTFVLVIPSAESQDTGPCVSSVGYKMMQYYQGAGWDSFGLLLFTIHFINGFTDQVASIGDITSLGLLCIIFYFFSDTMSEFAGQLTGGPSMKGVTASASGAVGAIIDQVKNAYNKAKAAATSAAGDKGGGGKAGDKGGGEGASRAGDSARGGAGKAGDTGGG